jgi:hypothetical protein
MVGEYEHKTQILSVYLQYKRKREVNILFIIPEIS